MVHVVETPLAYTAVARQRRPKMNSRGGAARHET